MSIYLNKYEIQEITHRLRCSAQIRALQDMHIPHKIRPDGTPLVSRSAFEQAMGFTHTNSKNDHLIDQPNFGDY